MGVGSTEKLVRLIETRNHATGRRVRSSRLATRDSITDSAEPILQHDLSALINEGIKLVAVDQDPARCTANTEASLPIALHR
jgi:hypothetical protein